MSRDLAITFGGGGNRAFYETGLLRRLGGELWPRVAGVAACSAGACVAVLHLADREEPAHRFWLARRAGVTRNLDPARWLRGERLAPHFEIYRDTLLCALADGGLERIRALPFPVLILAAGLPRGLPATAAALIGLAAFTVERRLRPRALHPTFGRRLGFRPVVIDARTCETPAELASVVLASSATPPFTPVGAHRGRLLLDGGLLDGAPASVADAVPGVRRNLVLLTRPLPPEVSPRRGHRLYLAPSRALPIGRWDYTRPEALAATIAVGESDAPRHAPALRTFLA